MQVRGSVCRQLNRQVENLMNMVNKNVNRGREELGNAVCGELMDRRNGCSV